MIALAFYFMFGAGFYVGLSVHNPKGFIEADAASLIRGFLIGFIFWPVGLIFSVYMSIKELGG